MALTSHSFTLGQFDTRVLKLSPPVDIRLDAVKSWMKWGFHSALSASMMHTRVVVIIVTTI
ncbi:hypothetical protein D3C85_1525140 [compost metagenome]